MKLRTLISASLLSTFPLASHAQLASSTFDSGDAGWVVRDVSTFGNPPAVNQTWNANYQASGGNPGGMIWAPDVSSGPVTLFQAPSAFLGNKLGAYGGSFIFDMQISNWNVTNKPGLILVGSGWKPDRRILRTGQFDGNDRRGHQRRQRHRSRRLRHSIQRIWARR